MPSFSFRARLVVLAVVLVAAIECVILAQTLSGLKLQQRHEAERAVELAGGVYDELRHRRTERLTRAADALVHDLAAGLTPIRENRAFIEAVLQDNAHRAGIDAAAVFGLEGDLVASVGDGRLFWPKVAMQQFALDPTSLDPVVSVALVDGKPYETVTVPIVSVIPVAWVTMGVPIGAQFSEGIRELTQLDVTILGFRIGGKRVYATTLPGNLRDKALAGVRLGDAKSTVNSDAGDNWITELRPYSDESDGIYVALQLPRQKALAGYRALRGSLIKLASAGLLLTLGVAIWLPRMLTRPIGRLAGACRRVAEGIYDQPVDASRHDELGALAQDFNTMQKAIARREQHILDIAHHDSLSGLPTREMLVSEIRNAIAGVDRLAVIDFVIHRFDELAASLGHRTADRLLQLVAGCLREQLADGRLVGHVNHHEFVLVLPGAGVEEAQACIDEIQSRLRAGLAVGQANICLQTRAGVSLFPDHGTDASDLLSCAAIARGNAKRQAVSVGIYEPGQEDRPLELIRIVGDFPRALQDDELWIAFQPKIHC